MTNFSTIITIQKLAELLPSPDLAIFDCRFDLNDKDVGRNLYDDSHIPGAQYVDLERDLSAKPEGRNGRHPLPSIDQLAALFSRLGIDEDIQVVCYDDQGGGYAARMWWCLHYLGHRSTAILSGGFPAWFRAGLPVRAGLESRQARMFNASPDENMLIQAEKLLKQLDTNQVILIDSRAPERYRGEIEPWDPIAGHIPGAINRYWELNLDEQQWLLKPEVLHSDFKHIMGTHEASQIVFYCGSGVTGCLNVLSMLHAGLGKAKLYAGSWSEWCSNPKRPVQIGPKP